MERFLGWLSGYIIGLGASMYISEYYTKEDPRV